MKRRRIKTRPSKSKVTTTELPYTGSLDAPIMLVIDPVVGNLGAKTPMNKNQLQWFVDHLRDNAGFKKEEVCIISCAPPVSADTWGQGRLINEHLKKHREEFLKVLNSNKPKMVLPFGAKACQQIVGRSVQITKVRGQAFSEPDILGGVPVLPMLSPFYLSVSLKTKLHLRRTFKPQDVSNLADTTLRLLQSITSTTTNGAGITRNCGNF